MHRAAVGFHQHRELDPIDSVFGDLRELEKGRERKGERVGLWGEREREREKQRVKEREGRRDGGGGGKRDRDKEIY